MLFYIYNRYFGNTVGNSSRNSFGVYILRLKFFILKYINADDADPIPDVTKIG